MKIFHAIFIAAIFAATSAPVFSQDAPSSKGCSLNICTFNLRNPSNKNDGPKDDGTCSWENRKDLVKAFMQYRDIDVMGTQELYLHQINDLLTLEEYDAVGTAVVPGNEKTNNVIFFQKNKIELLESGAFWFSETPDVSSKGWDSHSIRNTNWAKFRDKRTGKEFFVFNSHFDHKGKVAKVESAKLISKKIKEIAGDANFFAMGDYNSNPESAALAEIKKAGFMKNSFDISKTTPYGPKFTNNYGWTGRGKDWTDWTWSDWIDYIFVNQSTEVLKFAVLSEAINGVYLSDHFPILIKAKIK